jgi:uncharacterized protein
VVAPRNAPLAGALPTVRRTLAAPDGECEVIGRPGSAGEHALQCAYGTETRADRFYTDQVKDRLLPAMVTFIERMEMAFVATSDAHGECDASLRAGPPGFLRVLDEHTVAYPEYRGNGVHASLGNITENPHIGVLMVDFVEDLIGLHVNGTARIVEEPAFRKRYPHAPRDVEHGRRAERWVVVEVEEAYVHCRKHIPRMQRVLERREWGTDDPGRKGGDYFRARGTPARNRPRRVPDGRRQPLFPSTTHLSRGVARSLRPRPV